MGSVHMKKCIYCKKEKDESEFYLRPNTHYYTAACKSCMKEKSKTPKKQQIQPHGEVEFIHELHSRGIPALHGKDFRIYPWVDVVAYGIVKIEIKTSPMNNEGYFSWAFTPTQIKKGLNVDVVALIEEYSSHKVYHFIDPKSEIFTNRWGNKKGMLLYPLSQENAHSQLTQHTLNRNIDNWEFIDLTFKRLCNNLRRVITPR